MTEDDVTVTITALGNVRVHVDHKESDSLAIIEVSHRGGNFSLRAGLRGNLDVHRRPMRWMSTLLHAPIISEVARLRRKADYIERRQRAGDSYWTSR